MNNKPKTAAPGRNTLWGGRFETGPGALMEQVNASIGFDKALAAQDLAGSRAHCTMLIDTGIISSDDGHTILKGLEDIEGSLIVFQVNTLDKDLTRLKTSSSRIVE